MDRSNPESLCALGSIVHHGYSLSLHEDAQQIGGGVAVDFGGSQPLCTRLHISESVQHPGPGWHTVCTGFGASPKQALQRLEPSRHTSFTRLIQAPAAAKRVSRPASDHHHLRTPPCPHSRFRPARGHGRLDSPNPQVPTAPRHPASTANPAAASTQPGRALLVAAVSPDGCTAHSTAVAVVPFTPRSATTDLRPHPSTRQARIQA